MKIAKLAKQKYQNAEFWLHRQRLGLKDNFSNLGEQRIIKKYIDSFGIAEQSKTIVDIGAGDGVRQSNSYALVMDGWRSVGVEYDNRKFAKLAAAYKFYPNAAAARCLVTPFNIVQLLEAHSIEINFGVLSLDIDSYDYHVLDAVLARFRPRLIVSEYNEKIPPPVKFAVNYITDFTLQHHFFGYSIAKLNDLLEKHGYVLLEVEYNNVFLAPAELPKAKNTDVLTAYREGYADRTDRREKFRSNHDMEILQNLNPAETVKFLDNFYARHKGKYEISAS